MLLILKIWRYIRITELVKFYKSWADLPLCVWLYFRCQGCQATPWWRNHREWFSASLAFCEGNPPVTGAFPLQRPVTRSFDVFFDLRLSKQSIRQWFETPSRSLWRHLKWHFSLLQLWGSEILIVILSGNSVLSDLASNHYLNQITLSSVHYNGVIMSTIASQITSVSIVCSVVCSGADQRKHQSSDHRWIPLTKGQ